MDLIELL